MQIVKEALGTATPTETLSWPRGSALAIFYTVSAKTLLAIALPLATATSKFISLI